MLLGVSSVEQLLENLGAVQVSPPGCLGPFPTASRGGGLVALK